MIGKIYMKSGLMNIISGLLKQVILLLLGLILPRLILTNYGSDVNGFISSVNQLITYLSLLEIGVGTATLQALYKPISLNNKNEINSIMAATHKFYKKTGLIYAIIVLIFSFAYPMFVKSSISSNIIIMFILLSGITGVINYLYQAKYKILLQAEGKNYIVTNLITLVTLFVSISKIILIKFNANILILQLSFVIFNIIQIIFINIYIKKNYGWLNINVKENFGAITQSKSVLLHEISYMVFAHTDMLILTLMCDLKIVSVYSIYNMIFIQVEGIINTFSSSIQFILGKTYSKSIEIYEKLYNIFEFIFFIISFIFLAITYICIEPFIKIYTSGISDVEYILPFLPLLFILIKVLSAVRTVINQTITVGGHFSNTKVIAISEAFINIVSTVFLVKHLGIYGVLIGTIIALLFRVSLTIIYVNKKVMNRSILVIIKRIFLNMMLLFSFKKIYINQFTNVNNYFDIIRVALVPTIIIVLIYIIINIIFDIKTTRNIIKFAKNRSINFQV